MSKIDKLEYVVIYKNHIQPKGTYYGCNGVPYEQKEDMEVNTSSARPPSNTEIMNKINEIIDKVNNQ